MTMIGTATSSKFSGSPEGLSRKRIRLAGPEYTRVIVIDAVKGTGPGTVQSLCAWPCPLATRLSSPSRTWIGKTASKYQPLGAVPVTVKVRSTEAPEAGLEIVTLAESGCVEDAAPLLGVEVTIGVVVAV